MERTTTLQSSTVGCLIVAVNVPLDGNFTLFASNHLSSSERVASNTCVNQAAGVLSYSGNNI